MLLKVYYIQEAVNERIMTEMTECQKVYRHPNVFLSL